MSVNKFKVDDVVKCVDADILSTLIVGKEYVVVAVNNCGMVNVKSEKGVYYYYPPNRFELSNGGSANAQQTHKSHKFKEGDMVYLIGFDCLKPCKLISRGVDYFTMKFKVEVDNGVFETFTEDGKFITYNVTPRIVLATEENRLMLNKLLGVEYEPLKLTGSDLAKKLLKDKPQTCYMSDISDDIALSDACIDVIAKFENGGFITMSGVHWRYAVPCNQHGEVLEDK